MNERDAFEQWQREAGEFVGLNPELVARCTAAATVKARELRFGVGFEMIRAGRLVKRTTTKERPLVHGPFATEPTITSGRDRELEQWRARVAALEVIAVD